MKFLLVLVQFVFATVCFSQVQFSSGASYLKGSGYYDNHAALFGGNLSMKYVIKDFVLVGVTGRIYQAATTAYENFNASDKQENLTGVAEVMFQRKNKVKPYLGISGGLSHTSHMINYVRNDDRYFVAGVHGGFQSAIGQSTGFFTQLSYNYIDGKGQPHYVDGVNNPVLTEGINRYWNFDVGLYIRLYVKTNK